MDIQPDDPTCHPYPIRQIVQTVFNSSRLTFEDETSVRHTLVLAKRLPSWKTAGDFLGAASLACCAAGTVLHLRNWRFVPEPFKLLSGRLLFCAGLCGMTVVVSKNLLQRSLLLKVESLMDLTREFSSLTKKITRWVQDNEVIQRSFVLASQEVTGGDQVLSARACLRLRRAAFLETRFAVFLFRAAALDLLREVIKESPLETTGNDICLIPLEEFGDCLSISEDDLEALYLSTDGFSLQALKSLVGLYDLQTSEFLKSLCTCVIANPKGLFKLLYLRGRLLKVTTLLTEAFHRLELEYRFETDEPMEPRLRKDSTKNHFTPPDYLRSLKLHLTAALKSVRTLGGEKRNTEDELERIVQQDIVEKLGYHVKCSSMLLDHLRRRSVANDQSAETSEMEISPAKSDFELHDVIKDDHLVHLEDEIFEAFIMGDAAGDHRGEPVMSDLNHFQEQKQQSRLILEEIKTLLSVRSADWKDRENRARERKGLPLVEGEEAVVPVERSLLDEPTENMEASATSSLFVLPSDIAAAVASRSSQWRSAGEESFGAADDSD